jgi:hypothetical protein
MAAFRGQGRAKLLAVEVIPLDESYQVFNNVANLHLEFSLKKRAPDFLPELLTKSTILQ